MMELIVNDRDVFRFDDQTGMTWVLKEDDDQNPVWVEIKNEETKEK